MPSYHTPLHIVFYYEQDRWIAHCLQFDLIGDGETKDEAIQNLYEAIALQVQTTIESQNFANLFSPAEGRVFDMFARGRNVAVGTLKLDVPGIAIEDVLTRECSDSVSVPA
jgi:predicted RNase H-like HicB family nuclease